MMYEGVWFVLILGTGSCILIISACIYKYKDTCILPIQQAKQGISAGSMSKVYRQLSSLKFRMANIDGSGDILGFYFRTTSLLNYRLHSVSHSKSAGSEMIEI